VHTIKISNHNENKRKYKQSTFEPSPKIYHAEDFGKKEKTTQVTSAKKQKKALLSPV
jgi:hypothetical protein